MDAEYSEKCLKNIENELDQSFVQIKLKNTEKKNDELVCNISKIGIHEITEEFF